MPGKYGNDTLTDALKISQPIQTGLSLVSPYGQRRSFWN